jgi:hypothetical protein
VDVDPWVRGQPWTSRPGGVNVSAITVRGVPPSAAVEAASSRAAVSSRSSVATPVACPVRAHIQLLHDRSARDHAAGRRMARSWIGPCSDDGDQLSLSDLDAALRWRHEETGNPSPLLLRSATMVTWVQQERLTRPAAATSAAAQGLCPRSTRGHGGCGRTRRYRRPGPSPRSGSPGALRTPSLKPQISAVSGKVPSSPSRSERYADDATTVG